MLSLRGTTRKKRLLLAAIGLLAGTYILMSSQFTLLRRLKNLSPSDSAEDTMEYTLPSLDDVINSVVDLDFQRAVATHGVQFEKIPEGTPKINIIIASTWRSGSTLLGEILNSYPGVYYHYEPLLHYGMTQFAKGQEQSEVEGLLRSLLQCDYRNQVPYLKFAYGTPEIFVRNTRLWRFCSAMPRFKCYMPEILGKLCSLFPVHVMKLVRIRLSALEPLLHNQNTKIILLTRDPRAVMSSRTLNVDWCTTKDCKSPRNLCSDLLDDVNVYTLLKAKYPGQIMLLRYEDLAKDPYGKSEAVIKFAGLSMEESVTSYLNEHLGSEFEAPWSTIHDPKKQMTKWMKIAPWDTIVETQYYCRPVMKLLGYRAFDSKTELSIGNAIQILNIE